MAVCGPDHPLNTGRAAYAKRKAGLPAKRQARTVKQAKAATAQEKRAIARSRKKNPEAWKQGTVVRSYPAKKRSGPDVSNPGAVPRAKYEGFVRDRIAAGDKITESARRAAQKPARSRTNVKANTPAKRKLVAVSKAKAKASGKPRSRVVRTVQSKRKSR